jgi:hypothetical protein
MDFDLTDAEAEMIAGLEKDGRIINPSWAPDWD